MLDLSWNNIIYIHKQRNVHSNTTFQIPESTIYLTSSSTTNNTAVVYRSVCMYYTHALFMLPWTGLKIPQMGNCWLRISQPWLKKIYSPSKLENKRHRYILFSKCRNLWKHRCQNLCNASNETCFILCYLFDFDSYYTRKIIKQVFVELSLVSIFTRADCHL